MKIIMQTKNGFSFYARLSPLHIFFFIKWAISSKSVEIFWAEIYWGRLFFRAESSLIQSNCRSFIRVIVPYEISKVNFRVKTQILVSMSEEI
jgi:hypothetical protein